MASTDASAFPVKGKAFRVTFPILDADGDLVTGAGALDSEVSKDAGTFTDATAEATEIATSSGVYYLDLTASEMTADTVAVIVKTSTSGAKTTTLVLYPVDLSEPSAVPGYGTDDLDRVFAWLLALNRNKMTQTSTTSTLRNDADSANLATSAVSDDGTTFNRGEWG